MTYLKLFAHNILVGGKEKSCIYDLHNNDVVMIPNIFADIINDCKQHPIKAVQENYAPDDPEVFDQYVQFVINKNLGFVTEEPHLFGELNTDWNQPHHIQNAMIAYNEKSDFDLKEVILTLDELLCRQLEIRVDSTAFSIDDLSKELAVLNSKIFRSVTLLLRYHPSMTAEAMEQFYTNIPKLGYVFIFDSPATRELESYKGKVLYSDKKLADYPFGDASGNNSKYIVNITYFMEALRFNPFYNKKVAIDEMGNIKNDLMLSQVFGNVKNDDLKTVVEDEAFQELWHAGPDKIRNVQDSALRYCQHIPFELKKLDDGSYEIAG